MSYTEVRLIAHAEPLAPHPYVADTNPLGVGLSQKGAREALQIGKVWSNDRLQIDAVHSAPLLACVQTALLALELYHRETGRQVVVAQPAELCMNAMYDHLQKAQGPRNKQVCEANATTSLGTNAAKIALNGATQMWRYLDLLRIGSVNSAVAVTDAASINSILTFIDMGSAAAAENPAEYLRHTIESEPLEPGSESFIVLEDVQGAVRPRVQYAGMPLWEMME